MRQTTIVFFMLLALAACGPRSTQPPPDQVKLGLQTALAATNAAREVFLLYSRDQEKRIAETATSLEDGKKRLADFRAKADDVAAAFAIAYTSIAAAETARQVGGADGVRAVALAQDALLAVLEVRTAVAQLRGGGR